MSTERDAKPRRGAIGGVQFDDLGPRRVFCFNDPAVGLEAFVVVDTLRGGPSGGGVRMMPDVSLEEVARLARAMTYKYAMLPMPVGGAKSGIRLDPASPSRPTVMRAYLEAIQPLVQAGTFVPGPDMGTRAEDFAPLLPISPGASLDVQLTGYGVVAAAKAAAEHVGRSLDGARVAIEGFGKVGTAAARFFAREGARLVAVSTVRAAVYNPRGFDVEKLIALQREHGDEGIERAEGAEIMPHESLFTLDVDVLVPGARPDVIHDGNVEDIKAGIIVPGSNVPYAEGTLSVLERRGILALPDFVSNAGGVLATVCALQGMTSEASNELVNATVSANVERVLARAKETGTCPHDAAVMLAREKLATD